MNEPRRARELWPVALHPLLGNARSWLGAERQIYKELLTLNHKPFILAAALLLASVCARGQGMTKGVMTPPSNVRPPGLKEVGIEQNLNQQIPPDLSVRDETGKTVRLGDYFGKRPLILNLVYFQCPMLC